MPNAEARKGHAALLHPAVVGAALEEKHLAIFGDATDEEVLLHAGIREAHTIVIALRSDADNVFVTLPARNLAPTLRILARGEQVATEKKRRQAGADQVVLPAVIGGRRMAAEGINVFNPAFDVTPNDLVSGIITEHGVVDGNYTEGLAAKVAEGRRAR